MHLNALLMCREHESLRVIAAALDYLAIDQEVCLSAPEAMEAMAQNHYSALVLDFDLPAAAQVARMARSAPPQRRPVVFAMIGALTDIAATFQAGANFVLYKPLEFSQLMRSLRAGQGFMQPDRRKSPRQKLETIVYLQYGIAALPALMLDVNDRGLSLQAAEPLPCVQEVPLRFVLPGTERMIEGVGELIWADDGGRAGMLFSELPAESSKALKAWLSKQQPRKNRSRSAPTVRATRMRPLSTQ
jgi:CheY-like chemotaxis protein